MATVSDLRISLRNTAPVRPDGEFVLYWMIAARRATWNYALQRAAGWARDLGKPLIVLEELPCGNPWDSDRLHRFALDGMADTSRLLAGRGVVYYPYVERATGDAADLVAALAARAAVVVTDEFPCFVWPAVVARAAAASPVRLEQVDSCGLLPLLAADRVFTTAHAFRRFLQRTLPEHLEFPAADPLAGMRLPPARRLPTVITRRWPPASARLLAGDAKELARLPIDHAVPPVETRGGTSAAEAALRRFLNERLDRYAAGHNHPDDEATSGLSPYLRFGHISVHQVLAELAGRRGWSAEKISGAATGAREGWWGLDSSAEAFLDELVTWREIGFNLCRRRPDDYDRYESLPAWARATLAEHARDRRAYRYTPAEFAAGATHDRLWNAAQAELRDCGRIHNYLRMLWGKKILEWSPSPEEALAVMIHLNNRYALDGRDPNSYTGILWVLGRYDRAWGPERPIFGKIRYMSSDNTLRKLRLRRYLEAHGCEGAGGKP